MDPINLEAHAYNFEFFKVCLFKVVCNQPNLSKILTCKWMLSCLFRFCVQINLQMVIFFLHIAQFHRAAK